MVLKDSRNGKGSFLPFIPTHILQMKYMSISDCECILLHFSPPQPSLYVCVSVWPWAPFRLCVCPHAIVINSCFWTLPDYRSVFKPISNGSSLLVRPTLLHLDTCIQGSHHTHTAIYTHLQIHICFRGKLRGRGSHSNPVVSVGKRSDTSQLSPPRSCQEAFTKSQIPCLILYFPSVMFEVSQKHSLNYRRNFWAMSLFF